MLKDIAFGKKGILILVTFLCHFYIIHKFYTEFTPDRLLMALKMFFCY